MRVYLQMQMWQGKDAVGTEWGWKVWNDILVPIYTCDDLIPNEIAKKIACRYETGCKGGQCGCKKRGLKCTNVCLKCDEENCQNYEASTSDFAVEQETENNDNLETEQDNEFNDEF